MAGLSSSMSRPRPPQHPVLVHLDDEAAKWARRLALAAGAAAIMLFAVLIWREGIPRSIQPRQWEILSQLAVLGIVTAGYMFAWKWELAGALTMLVGSVLLGVLASIAYAPADALAGCLAFFVPGVLFLLHWQRRHSPIAVASLVAGIVALLAFGGIASARVYNYYYGPTHPESTAPEIPIELVTWIWSGAVTADSFTVKAHLADDVTGAELRVMPSDGREEVRVIAGTLAATNDRLIAFEVTGLEPVTEYRYAVASGDRVDEGRTGRVTTFPDGPASFTIALGACIQTGSNGQVFDRIRELNPSLLLVTGDFHYGDVSANDPERLRDMYERNLEQPGQQALYLSAPIAYVWDDHDFGGNDSSAVADSRFASRSVYTEYVPHYALGGAGDVAISQAFTLGRVRFIMLDTRSGRTPNDMPDGPDKTMLGSEQRAWFEQELLEANGKYPLIVVVTSVPWIAEASAGADNWGGFAHERNEIANFIAENDIKGVALFGGDAHMLAIDDGTNSDYSATGDAPLPVFQAGALDRRGTTKGGPYSEGMFPGGGQFGVMRVEDNGGPTITVHWTGLDWEGKTIVELTFESPVVP